MKDRYRRAKSRKDKSLIIDEIVSATAFNRKYVLQKLNGLLPPPKAKSGKPKPLRYQEAVPAIRAVWRALDYPCAERLHPVWPLRRSCDPNSNPLAVPRSAGDW